MTKETIFEAIPRSGSGVLSDTVAAGFPVTIDRDKMKRLMVGVYTVAPFNPVRGEFNNFPVSEMLYNPVTDEMEYRRTAGTIKKVGPISAAGDAAVWTPAAGKRIRLMGYNFTVAPGVTTVAGSIASLGEGATPFLNLIAFAVAASTTSIVGSSDLGPNGYLLGVNSVLNLNLSAALSVSGIYLSVWGTEE